MAGDYMNTYRISLGPIAAADAVRRYVESAGATNECVADYRNRSEDGREVAFLVFEKYMMRNSSRISLSVAIENVGGATVVAAAGSGGGENVLFKFDWGAGKNVENLIPEALAAYMI
jgi:hypothetical protein